MKSVRSVADLQRLALSAGTEAELGGHRFNAGASGTAVRPALAAPDAPTPASPDALAPELRALREAFVAMTAAIEANTRALAGQAQPIGEKGRAVS